MIDIDLESNPMSEAEELYAALEAVELVLRRQQAELDHLRLIERAASLFLAVIELEPWRLTAPTFGPVAERAGRSLTDLRSLLGEQ